MMHPAFDGTPDEYWRLPGDTWDDAVVLEVAEEKGLLQVSEEGKVTIFGQEFPGPDEIKREFFSKGELFRKARNALIQLIVNAPSDGKLKIKKKKKKKTDDED